MKYIIINDVLDAIPNLKAIIFDETLDHSFVAGAKYQKVVSAGFCQIKGTSTDYSVCNKTSCYGESVSLNKKSRPEDVEIIDRTIDNWNMDSRLVL